MGVRAEQQRGLDVYADDWFARRRQRQQNATFAVTVANPLPAGMTQISNTASIADDGANGSRPDAGEQHRHRHDTGDRRARPLGHQERRRRDDGAGRHGRLHDLTTANTGNPARRASC